MLAKLRELPELRDVSTDQQNRGLQAMLVIDRDTASRLGVMPQAIDDTLYDAFGQRQVSTIFTQLNQYRVVLEVDPRFQQDPDALKSVYVRSSGGKPVPLAAFARFDPDLHAARGQPPGPVPGGHALLQPRPRHRAGRRGHRHPRGGARDPAAADDPGHLPGHRPGLPGLAGQPAAADPGRADHRLHRARRALRELHPPDHHPLHAALGGRGRAPRAAAVRARPLRDRDDRHHPAHRHREEERDHDDRLRARGGARARASRRRRRSTRPACCASARS